MPPKKRPEKSTHRPSDGEICGKVSGAIAALEAKPPHFKIVAHKHDERAFRFLGVSNIADVLSWTLVFLKEIQEIGPTKCFISHGKAERCTEPKFSDIFLFPYVFKSLHFEEKVYLKFGIRKSTMIQDPPHYYCHLDLHDSDYA